MNEWKNECTAASTPENSISAAISELWSQDIRWQLHICCIHTNIYRSTRLLCLCMEESFLSLSITFLQLQSGMIFTLMNLSQLSETTCESVLKTATAMSLQSCLTLCDPRDSSPPGSPVPGILQARTLEWVAISFSNAWKWKVKVKLLVSNS